MDRTKPLEFTPRRDRPIRIVRRLSTTYELHRQERERRRRQRMRIELALLGLILTLGLVLAVTR